MFYFRGLLLLILISCGTNPENNNEINNPQSSDSFTKAIRPEITLVSGQRIANDSTLLMKKQESGKYIRSETSSEIDYTREIDQTDLIPKTSANEALKVKRFTDNLSEDNSVDFSFFIEDNNLKQAYWNYGIHSKDGKKEYLAQNNSLSINLNDKKNLIKTRLFDLNFNQQIPLESDQLWFIEIIAKDHDENISKRTIYFSIIWLTPKLFVNKEKENSEKDYIRLNEKLKSPAGFFEELRKKDQSILAFSYSFKNTSDKDLTISQTEIKTESQILNIPLSRPQLTANKIGSHSLSLKDPTELSKLLADLNYAGYEFDIKENPTRIETFFADCILNDTSLSFLFNKKTRNCYQNNFIGLDSSIFGNFSLNLELSLLKTIFKAGEVVNNSEFKLGPGESLELFITLKAISLAEIFPGSFISLVGNQIYIKEKALHFYEDSGDLSLETYEIDSFFPSDFWRLELSGNLKLKISSKGHQGHEEQIELNDFKDLSLNFD